MDPLDERPPSGMPETGEPVERVVFSVRAETRDDTIFVLCEGELDLAGEPTLVGAVERAWTTAQPAVSRLVVDTSDVSFIDSSGLHALLRCREAVAAQGVEFVLRAPAGGPVERLIDIAGIGPWFATG